MNAAQKLICNELDQVAKLCLPFKEVELHVTSRWGISISSYFMMGLLIGYALFVVTEESRFVIV